MTSPGHKSRSGLANVGPPRASRRVLRNRSEADTWRTRPSDAKSRPKSGATTADLPSPMRSWRITGLPDLTDGTQTFRPFRFFRVEGLGSYAKSRFLQATWLLLRSGSPSAAGFREGSLYQRATRRAENGGPGRCRLSSQTLTKTPRRHQKPTSLNPKL